MGKQGRRPRAGEQIAAMAAKGRKGYPRTIEEALRRGDETVQAVTIRNARQRAMLDRASRLMGIAIEECTCGGVKRAIEKEKADADASTPE